MTALTILIPVGPRCREEFILDTLDSIAAHCHSGYRLIVLDDSGDGRGARIAADRGHESLATSGHGLAGGLYRTLSAGFLEALRKPFDVLLRLDTDALVAGESFAQRAHECFVSHPRVGCLGSHRTAYAGEPRSFEYPADRIRELLSTRKALRWRRSTRLGALLLCARRHGYTLGEHVMGGIAIYSRAAVLGLARAGLLSDVRLAATGLEEDHIFGLCLRALGFGLQGFGSAEDDLPFGVAWCGLPAAPEDLLAAGKELIHSTRFYGDRGEAEIREIFRRARQSAGFPA
jgi:glycosyltransferase involved in cell wall biosynthesis